MAADQRLRVSLEHPVCLLCMILLGCNDRYWKYHYPNWFTGKLSDFAGLVVLPLCLWSGAQLVYWLRAKQQPALSLLNAILILCGVSFAAIKVSSDAGEFYVAQASYLLAHLDALASSLGAPALFTSKAHHFSDPTDLIALPSLLIARWIGTRGRTPAH